MSQNLIHVPSFQLLNISKQIKVPADWLTVTLLVKVANYCPVTRIRVTRYTREVTKTGPDII